MDRSAQSSSIGSKLLPPPIPPPPPPLFQFIQDGSSGVGDSMGVGYTVNVGDGWIPKLSTS